MAYHLYTNLRTLANQRVDLHCVDGRIAAVAPHGSQLLSADVERHDGGGRLLLPALVESHIHLDKTMWNQPWRPNSGGPRLIDYITNERRVLRAVEAPIIERASALLENCIALGSLKLRSHVDVDTEIGFTHVEAMLALRDKYRRMVDLDFVVFPQSGLLINPGTAELMARAIEMGVECVGGLDPAGIDNDPNEHLRIIFDLAGKHGCGIDIHLHDAGELGVWQIERIADFTAAAGLAGKVMISHAYCLGMVPTGQIEKLGRRLADQRISLMTTAPSDIGLPPVSFLRELGVNICCGSDGIRDAWTPFGIGDMLERALLLALRFDWTKDAEIAAAFDCVTVNGARALGLAIGLGDGPGGGPGGYGIEPGCAADCLLIDAETLGDAIARRSRDRIVIRGGDIIAENGAVTARH
jgi:cytosine deaminase